MTCPKLDYLFLYTRHAARVVVMVAAKEDWTRGWFLRWQFFPKIVKTQKNQQPCTFSHRKPHYNLTPDPNPNHELKRTLSLNF